MKTISPTPHRAMADAVAKNLARPFPTTRSGADTDQPANRNAHANPRFDHARKTADEPRTRRTNVTFHHFPLSNFRYFLTLFPKFFSSFPHGTCSLSVSGGYLALEEAYLPISAAIPNNATRRNAAVRGELRGLYGVLTLCDTLFQTTCPQVHHWPTLISLQRPATSDRASQLELFPLHSPLLGESLLVSFPRLINMLKFGRSSYLTSGQSSELVLK